MDRVVGGQGRDRLEERGLVRAKAVEADHRFGPVAGDEARDRGARNLDVGDPQQRRPVAREPEEPFESEGEIEVAARVEAALCERVEAGEAPLAQADPGSGIAPDDHVGLAGGGRADVDSARPARGPPRFARRPPAVSGRWRRSRGRLPGSATASEAKGLFGAPHPLRLERNARSPRGALRCPTPSRSLTHRRAARYPSEWSQERLAAVVFPQIASTNRCVRFGSRTR